MLRHQLIQSLTPPHTEKAAEAAIVLWEQMAERVIAIIGVGGFNSLYARNLFLFHSNFPWLAASPLSLQADQRFSELKKSLEGQAPSVAIEANNRLLCTFTDILATLIGEELTSNILRSAWGNDASDKADMELKNE